VTGVWTVQFVIVIPGDPHKGSL